MDKFVIACLGVLEIVALVVIIRLWLHRRFRLIPRIVWSVILLIPILGLLIFLFVTSDLDRNPERRETQTDFGAPSSGEGQS
jgi:hypothetical protein